MERHRPRILLADDHTLIAQGCKTFLEPEFEVVGIVSDGRAMIEAALKLKPEVVILDVAMPNLNGLDAGEQLKEKMKNVKLVFLTMHLEPDLAAEAFRRGASAYVLKSSAAEELVLALRAVLRGESYITSRMTKDTFELLLQHDPQSGPQPRITPRQTEVLQLLAEGKSMKEVADILKVKPGTVAFHKYKMMESLGIRTNAELLQYAIKHHILG